MGRLQGKVVLITGAAGDIGKSLAVRFASEGASVMCADIDMDGANVSARAAANKGIAQAVQCDVSDSVSAAESIREVEARFSRLDVLINNAAVASPYEPVHSLDEMAWRKALDVNLTGAFLMSKFAVPAMLRNGSGSIIHMASQMGHVGACGRAAYGVTKAALIHLARIMALDYGSEGIRVNSLSPGAVMTSRVVARYGTESLVKDALESRYPLNRIGAVDEIAAAAVFLASDEASFITGTDLLVDGGYTAQ